MAPRQLDNAVRLMPDIAAEARPAIAGTLDWVGMNEIEVPVRLPAEAGEVSGPARVSAFVNLTRPEVRGIHMSRLYLHVDRLLSSEVVSPCTVRRVLKESLD